MEHQGAKNLIRTVLLALLAAGVGVGAGFLWLGSDEEPPYHRVEDGLWIGGSVERPPPETRAVVNLCGREDPYKVEASLWEPILEVGREPPTVDWLRRVVGFIETQRRLGRPVYVHCMAGIDRSATVVTAYLMHEHGWSGYRALAYLRGKRPIVRPDPMMMKLLEEWESALTGRHPTGR